MGLFKHIPFTMAGCLTSLLLCLNGSLLGVPQFEEYAQQQINAAKNQSRWQILESHKLALRLNIPALNGAIVRHIKVKNQGKTLTCGQHSIKNGPGIYEFVTSKHEQSLLEIKKILHNNAQSQGFDSGTAPDELMELIDQSEVNPHSISIINSINQFVPALKENPEHAWLSLFSFVSDEQQTIFVNALQKFLNKENIIHVFIVGLQNNNGMHWIPIVVQQLNGKLSYNVADSSNNRLDTVIRSLPLLHRLLTGQIIKPNQLSLSVF